MSRLIPSREAMEDFVVLLKRYLSTCRLCVQEDARRWATEPHLPLILAPYSPQLDRAQETLPREIRDRLAISDFLVPFGWPDYVNQALERLRSGELYYDETRFREEKEGVVIELTPIFGGGKAVGRLRRINKDVTIIYRDGKAGGLERKTKGLVMVFSPSKAEAMLADLERLIEDLETTVAAGTGVTGKPATPAEWETERQIIETLQAVGHRLQPRSLLARWTNAG